MEEGNNTYPAFDRLYNRVETGFDWYEFEELVDASL